MCSFSLKTRRVKIGGFVSLRVSVFHMMLRTMLETLLLLVSVEAGSYVPGSPGAAWTRAEILAVKAKLRLTFGKPKSMPNLANKALGTSNIKDNGGSYDAAKVFKP